MRKSLFALLLSVSALTAFAQERTTLLDFTNSQLNGYRGPRIESLTPTPEGLHVITTGETDPWIEGQPLYQLPSGDYTKMFVEIRFKGTGSKSIEMFWGTPGFVASQAVTFKSKGDDSWQTAEVIVPRFPKGTRLRFDPCVDKGTMTLAWVRAYPVVNVYEPKFDKPTTFNPQQLNHRMKSGSLFLDHSSNRWDAYTISCHDAIMASGHSKPEIAVLLDGKSSTLDLSGVPVTMNTLPNGFEVNLSLKDALGATWRLKRQFTSEPNNAIAVTTSVTVDQDRQVANFPWITLFPGLGSFGEHKSQALLAGIEYLVDEPSSNELDVRGPKANRLSSSDEKLCFPLMAVVANHHWLALSWNAYDYPATIFDMPDRQFKSGANLWALWSPGPREKRLEGELATIIPFTLKAGVTVTRKAILAVGDGDTVVPAIQDYATRNPLPSLPVYDGGFQGAVSLLADGYMDSSICEGNQFRHAWNGNPKSFGAANAGDAFVFMNWLLRMTNDDKLAKQLHARLLELAPLTVNGAWAGRSIGHDSWYAFQYLFFDVIEKFFTDHADNSLRDLSRVRPDGTIRYQAPVDKVDYGVGHWTDHANGLTAVRLLGVTKTLRFTARKDLREAYLAWVDKLFAAYDNDVPRGAQTWEIPLHTPDILASAYMLYHAVCAYNLTGKEKYRSLADYWAWTGVPFIYLVDPSKGFGPVGPYSTIAVLGATNWSMPFWIGLPVQWCGCVYRNALYDYADMLKDNPEQAKFWSKIADGITITGVQMTFAENKDRGLLPDSYKLHSQVGGGPAINPGTVLISLPRAYQRPDIYGKAVIRTGVFANAFGSIAVKDATHLALDLWPSQATPVVICGLDQPPKAMTWNGQAVNFQWFEEHKSLVVKLQGKGELAF